MAEGCGEQVRQQLGPGTARWPTDCAQWEEIMQNPFSNRRWKRFAVARGKRRVYNELTERKHGRERI